jgi:site-specific DNA-methyltransferase (cytosine-N4-specific)
MHCLQIPLFESSILDAYIQEDVTHNAKLYKAMSEKLNIDDSEHIKPVGKSGLERNTFHRKIRWGQQNLKFAGLIENLGRGQWRVTKKGKTVLTETLTQKHLVAFSTDLGMAIWGNSANTFSNVIDEDIHLCVTSPPYLDIQRSYGTHSDLDAYINFIISILEPIRARMVPGANLALNVTNDTVLKKRFGERSMYLEEMTLAIAKRLDFHLMDRLMWHAPDKSPKGYQVTHKRTHLTSRYEPILWFCTAPEHCLADNRRVLSEYSEYMTRLIANGGESHNRLASDYTANSRKGGFSNDNGGCIPSNVLSFPTFCNQNRDTLKYARRLGLNTHGALYPQSLASFLIRWLAPNGGMVVDPFGGYSTTGAAAQEVGYRWITSELHWEYVRPALSRFTQCDGFVVNPLLTALDDEKMRIQLAS